MEGYINKEQSKKSTKGLISKKLCVDIEKKIIFLILSFSISLLTFKENALITIIPILAIGYLLDFGYLIFAILSSAIGCVVLGSNYFLCYAIMLFTFCFFAFISQIFSFKLYTRIGVCVFVGDICSRIIWALGNKQAISIDIIAYSLISLCLYCLGIQLLQVFLHKRIERITQGCALSIGIVIFLAIFGISKIINNTLLIYILIHLSLLMISRIYGVSLLSYIVISIAFLLFYFFDMSFKDISLFCLPTLVSYLLGKSGKYQAGVAYILAYICLGLLQSRDIFDYNFFLIPVIVIVLFSCVPSALIQEGRNHILNVETFEMENISHVKKIENEVVKKLNKFSTLFDVVSKEYKDDESYKLAKKQTSTIFKNLCINCPKNKICYQNSSVENIPLFLKSITFDLSSNDIKKINENCLKPSRFLELSASLKNDFYLEYQYDQQYKNLKKALSYQMLGFKDILDSYSAKIKTENLPSIHYKDVLIKRTLESMNVDVLFVKSKVEIDGKVNFLLDIKVDKIQDIYSLVIPSLENALHCYLKVKEIKEVILENYYALNIVEYEAYDFILGIHQRSKENQVIGDSYISFSDSFNQVFAISDGMGVGEEARDESKTTIRLLKEVLECDMDIKHTIMMVNSLLKTKNRYDTYATLDLINIDKKTLKANFSKNGSPFSYVYRGEELIKIDPSSLPIGIVDDIEVYDCSINLQDGDYIIMFSDGISGSEKKMKEVLNRCKNYHPQILAKEILDSYVGKKIKDDTTVMVIKVQKRKNN